MKSTQMQLFNPDILLAQARGELSTKKHFTRHGTVSRA